MKEKMKPDIWRRKIITAVYMSGSAFVMQEVLCRFRSLYILQKATVRSNHHVIFFIRNEN